MWCQPTMSGSVWTHTFALYVHLTQDMHVCLELLRIVENCWELLRIVENCRQLWRTVWNCWGLWRTAENCRKLWRTVENCWELSRALGNCWELWTSVHRCMPFPIDMIYIQWLWPKWDMFVFKSPNLQTSSTDWFIMWHFGKRSLLIGMQVTACTPQQGQNTSWWTFSPRYW